MANTKMNSLAELAERLMHHLECANAVAGFNQRVWSDIRKAQRIVAELGKVKFIELAWGFEAELDEDATNILMLKCNEIAEEGEMR